MLENAFANSRIAYAHGYRTCMRSLLGAVLLFGLGALSACETLMGDDDLAAMRWANPGKSDDALKLQWDAMDSQDHTDVVDAHKYQFVSKKRPPTAAVIGAHNTDKSGGSGGNGGNSGAH